MSDQEAGAALERLLGVMRQLRDPTSGCPWDLEQDFASIAPYTIEEAYEVADAIERGEAGAIREELGDLLFQVVFHSRIAEERGWFGFADVAASIANKLTRRHPHVFAGAARTDSAAQSASWEALKAEERSARGDRSALADVPRALPSLTRARKLGKRAAQLNFDFDDAATARAKVEEELAELEQELRGAEGGAAGERSTRIAEEFGDVLFALVNFARHIGVDAEESLRGANARFERRFRLMEEIARSEGLALGALTAARWDELWERAKRLAAEDTKSL